MTITNTDNGSSKFDKPYLNHKEAAEYLGVSPATLYGWVYKGQITPLKAGGLNRYRAADLDAFLEKAAA